MTTPAEFAQIGEAQTEELVVALTEQAGKLGGSDWSAKLDELKADHPDADGLLPAYQRELERLEAFVFQEDLATNPDAMARVEANPEFLRPVMGFAAAPRRPVRRLAAGVLLGHPAARRGRPARPRPRHHPGRGRARGLSRPPPPDDQRQPHPVADPAGDPSSVMIEGWGLYTGS